MFLKYGLFENNSHFKVDYFPKNWDIKSTSLIGKILKIYFMFLIRIYIIHLYIIILYKHVTFISRKYILLRFKKIQIIICFYRNREKLQFWRQT